MTVHRSARTHGPMARPTQSTLQKLSTRPPGKSATSTLNTSRPPFARQNRLRNWVRITITIQEVGADQVACRQVVLPSAEAAEIA